MAERRVLQPWEREALKVANTDLVQSIVNDHRSPPRPAPAPSANVQVVGAGKTVDFDYGPKYRPVDPKHKGEASMTEDATPAERSGWQREIPLRQPDGVALVDALCQQQDLRDLEAHGRAEAARMGISYGDWLRLMEKDLRERRERREKADKARKETPK
jgi:hypothetical protein